MNIPMPPPNILPIQDIISKTRHTLVGFMMILFQVNPQKTLKSLQRPWRVKTMPASPNTDSDEKEQLSTLSQELGRLQRQAIFQKIPVIILFEGADAAGKGTLINGLLLSLDPRGFKVHTMHSPSEDAIYRPFLWRYWTRTPAEGRMAIYDRSWYRLLLDDRVDGNVSDKQVSKVAREIKNFEQQLTDDGVVVIKIYLTISWEAQEERLKKLSSNPSTSWRVKEKDWKHHKLYDELQEKVEEMIHRTHAEKAPWVRIDSTDFKQANLELLKVVSRRLSQALEEKSSALPESLLI
jgi:AMP-polyphosphate phosphotransferase